MRRRCSSPGSAKAVASRRLRWPLASPIQRARKPASSDVERLLDALDRPPLLGERAGERLAVVEEDVDPDARVGAADPRHVAERAARGLQRVVAVDPGRAGLVEEEVREDVR